MNAILPGTVSPAISSSVSRLRGKRILVTGAGGSIGSALVQLLAQVLAQAVAGSEASNLILLDHSEFALYELERSLKSLDVGRGATCVLGSAGDEDLLDAIFTEHRPQIVFHTAAFKHVPLLERNPFAAIRNNVLATHALIEVAVEHGVEEFVHVSTDKAVDPQSIMGASKRIAELLLIVYANCAVRMSTVRLGNVWASQGSVVTLFLEQISQGRPLSVTDPDASRFFMTVDEAVTAILGALEPRSGGTVLIPHLAEPLRIVDLAHRLLEEHNSEASIRFTALRPGDKLTESLLSSRESFMSQVVHPQSILRAISSPAPSRASLMDAIAGLRRAVASSNLAALLEVVLSLVPEYSPSSVLLETGAEQAFAESGA